MHIPRSRCSKFGNQIWSDKRTFPISKNTQDAIRDKKRLNRAWMSKRKIWQDASFERSEYSKSRNKVKTLIRKAKREFEKNIAHQSKSNPKAFWAHTRRKLKSKCGVAPLLEDINDKDSLKFDDTAKANILQTQFSSIFTNEPDGEIPEMLPKSKASIHNLVVTEEMVLSKLKEINTNKSCGPDSMHPRILKELSNYIAKPIAAIFNASLQQGLEIGQHITDL